MDFPRPEPLAERLGMQLVELTPGHCAVRATVGPEHLNAHGTVHGGFVFTLADTAFGLAANSHGPVAFALAASIHFTRTALPGDLLLAVAREVTLGRTAATYEVTVSSDHQVIALFTGTVHRQEGRPAPASA